MSNGRSRSVGIQRSFWLFRQPSGLASQASGRAVVYRFSAASSENVGWRNHASGFPFPLLVERLQTPRDASRSPVFQVAVGWDTPRKLNLSQTHDPDSNGEPLAPGSLGLEPFALGQQGAAFDLMLMFLNAGDSVSAALQFNLDLFEESTIDRMVGNFLTLLAASRRSVKSAW